MALDARLAFERRSRGVLVARLVADGPAHLSDSRCRELRFSARPAGLSVDVDVDVCPGPGTDLLLTVRVRPSGGRRLLVRRPSASTRATTDEHGTASGLPVAPGPLSVVVLGPVLLQTEWLVV